MMGTGMLWQIVLLSLLGTGRTDADTSCTGLCGQRPLAKNFGNRVVGGVDARPGAWPWIVSIQVVYWNGQYRYHMCGGSLIAPNWVLTAAHCFGSNESNIDIWRLLIGAWDIEYGWITRPLSSKIQERKLVKIIPHENYNKHFQKNDIALVQLDRPIRCGDMARIACLPRPGDAPVKPNERCSVAGWGFKVEGAGVPAKILQEAEVNIIDKKVCNGSRWYYGYIHSNNLCAGYEEGKIDTCQGDSGGPLMCKDKYTNTYVVDGVTSWGTGCARAYKPGIYTSTWHFLDWIAAKIGPASIFTNLPPRPTTPITTPKPSTTTMRTLPPWVWALTYNPWTSKNRPWWIWKTTQKYWKGVSPQMWPHTEQPWPPQGSPLPRPAMYTTLRPWISNPVMVKAQAVGPSQALPLALSFPKRLRLLMDSMKTNKSV